MKVRILTAIMFFVAVSFISAQSLNWNSIEKANSSQVYLNLGFDFGMTTQLGFALKLKAKKPILLVSDISVPMGNELNDYKFRLGAQMQVLSFKSLKTSIQYMSILRRYETNLVRQIGIGQMLSMTTGIHKEGWSVAFELAYDASVASHLKHTDELRNMYSNIQDAWYRNTGGQWQIGFQASKKIGRIELNIRAGAINARGEDVDALLPAYAGLGAVVWL